MDDDVKDDKLGVKLVREEGAFVKWVGCWCGDSPTIVSKKLWAIKGEEGGEPNDATENRKDTDVVAYVILVDWKPVAKFAKMKTPVYSERGDGCPFKNGDGNEEP